MNTYTGYLAPPLYAIIINAKKCGWVPRPPSIALTSPEDVIKRLALNSSQITEDNTLDLRFATSLHERKHFIDMHISIALWRVFLAWFNCYSQIFTITPLLRDKRITLPLVSELGVIRSANEFSNSEKGIIKGICRGIYEYNIPESLQFVFDISASILQYSALRDYYDLSKRANSDLYRYLQVHFQNPLEEFGGDLDRAFCCYTFLSWFCTSYHELETIKNIYLRTKDYKTHTVKLLKGKLNGIIENELKRDKEYLYEFEKAFVKPGTELFPDVISFLSKLIDFRLSLLENEDLLIEIMTSTQVFIKWLSGQAIKTNYLVDFGRALPANTEITENYFVSKWITQNQRFIFYDDKLGSKIISNKELDNLANIQVLASELISPRKLYPFKSIICSEEFLGCSAIIN